MKNNEYFFKNYLFLINVKYEEFSVKFCGGEYVSVQHKADGDRENSRYTFYTGFCSEDVHVICALNCGYINHVNIIHAITIVNNDNDNNKFIQT